jgi:hypothetical protein
MSATQSPFILPETRQVQQAPSVATFTPVSNPTFTMQTATVAIPAEVPIPTPAPALISAPVTHGTAVVEPISTIAVPQPRPDFEGDGYSGNSLRIRG